MRKKGDPKYVEVTKVHLEIPYYNRKFRAPQGLVNHTYMHEHAGDTLYQRKAIGALPLPLKGGSPLTFTYLVQESIGYRYQKRNAMPSQCRGRDAKFFDPSSRWGFYSLRYAKISRLAEINPPPLGVFTTNPCMYICNQS